MPYKSEAQRKYFNANRRKLEAEGVDVDHWNTESKGKKLPKKANFLGHLLTAAGGATGGFAGPYANEKLKLGLSPRTARIGGAAIGSLGTGVAQLIAHKNKKKKKTKKAEKRAYGYEDDYGYIERVPWLNSQSRTEVLERMAKAQKLAEKQKLDVTYATSRWGEEGLSPEDAYKMVEALPDSAFTGEFGYGGTADTIPWSVSSSTRDGNKYNFRKDPLGIYDHMYGGDDDHEYDEYGNYNDHEYDEYGNYNIDPEDDLGNPIDPTNTINLEQKKSLLSTLFGKKAAFDEDLQSGIKKLTNQAAWYADKYKRMGPEATLASRLGAGLSPLPFYAGLAYRNNESLKPVAANALTTAALAPLLAYGLGGNKDRMKNLTDVRAYADTVPLAVGGGALAHVLTRLFTDQKPNAVAASPDKKENKEMPNIQELAKAAAITDYMPGFKNLATGFDYGKQQSRSRDLEAQRQKLVAPKMPAGNSLMDRIKKNTQMRKDMGIHRNTGLLGTTKAGSIAEVAKLAASCGSHGGKKKKKKKAADLAKAAAGRCWDGYEPVPGKDAYSDDSCRKVGSKKKKKTKKAFDMPNSVSELLKNKAVKGGLIGAGVGGLGGLAAELALPRDENDETSRFKIPLMAALAGGAGGSLAGAVDQKGFKRPGPLTEKLDLSSKLIENTTR